MILTIYNNNRIALTQIVVCLTTKSVILLVVVCKWFRQFGVVEDFF
jgi:hypothetical protein